MRIAVVQPPIRDFYNTSHRLSALGAGTVVKILEDAGHSVVLFNFPKDSQYILTPPLPKELNYLKPFLISDEKGPVSWFRQRKHFGPTFEECASRILESHPDRVMISCFAWCYAEEARELAEELKRRDRDLPLEIGGAGVSVFPEWFSRTGLFDEVRTGEAEENLSGFPGVEPVERGITPVLHQVDNYHGKTQFSAMLTRGCPCQCLFCANHLTHGREFRKIPPQEMISLLVKTGETQFHLNLEDDNLLADKAYFLNFLNQFHSLFPEATLSAENGLDYRKLSFDLITGMIEKGFIRFNLSMAASDKRILSSQNRSGRSEDLAGILKILNQKGIPAVTYFICGLKEDTVETACQNLLFLAGLPTEIGISPFYAVPGLPGFENRELLPFTPSVYCGSSVWPWNGNLSTAQLITAFRLSRFINLLKSKERRNWQPLIDMTLKSGTLHTVCGSGSYKTIQAVPLMDEEMSVLVIKGLTEELARRDGL